MKQLVQNLSNGRLELVESPPPTAGTSDIRIQTTRSLISPGTERMLLEFGRGNYLSKLRQQPEKAREAIQKARTDGVFSTVDAIRAKLNEPLVCGYSNVGRILDSDNTKTDLKPGQRVVSNGPHAEIVTSTANLCAPIPDQVADDAAAFTVLGSIALQGVRLANPTLGETVAVFGLGLIGLLTVQILRANGCRVIGIDFKADRLQLAHAFGAETISLSDGSGVESKVRDLVGDQGIDAAVICASTDSNAPIRQAAQICRKRGRIILVGVAGLDLVRSDFYEKELTFQVSCSYGPGRYDPAYEQDGIDYPLPYVRWTERRNFLAVLRMMADGAIDTTPLTTHRFQFDEAPDAYEALLSDETALGLLLEYPNSHGVDEDTKIPIAASPDVRQPDSVCVALIGSGNYATRVLIPALKATEADLHTIVSRKGLSASIYGRRSGFRFASSDFDAAIEDGRINSVVIATRHDSHAELVCKALNAGKHVFVEKPLALDLGELKQVRRAYEDALLQHGPIHLMVGFNRRFAPLLIRMKELLDQIGDPKAFILTMNAGFIPRSHWTQDPRKGGGRILGEACHYIDVLRFLTGANIDSLTVTPLRPLGQSSKMPDTATISISFSDGSTGAIHYFAAGNKSYPKERIEAFSGGRILQLDNFRRLRGWGWARRSLAATLKQDKGQKQCIDAFISAIRSGGPTPIPPEEIFEVSEFSVIAAEKSKC